MTRRSRLEHILLLLLRCLFDLIDEFAPCRMLDVGAWVGPVALYAAAKGCDVVAVEPDPVAAAVLRGNAAMSHMTVTVIEAALADGPGTMTLQCRRRVRAFDLDTRGRSRRPRPGRDGRLAGRPVGPRQSRHRRLRIGTLPSLARRTRRAAARLVATCPRGGPRTAGGPSRQSWTGSTLSRG